MRRSRLATRIFLGKHSSFLSILMILVLSLGIVWTQSGAKTKPPETRIDTVADTLHSVVVADPYRWLEDQEGAETRTWIDTQNEYTGLVKLSDRFAVSDLGPEARAGVNLLETPPGVDHPGRRCPAGTRRPPRG